MNKGVVFLKAVLIVMFCLGAASAIYSLLSLDQRDFLPTVARGVTATLLCGVSVVAYLWVSVQPGGSSTDIPGDLWVTGATIAAVVSIGCLGSFLFGESTDPLFFVYPAIGSIAGLLSAASFWRMLKK